MNRHRLDHSFFHRDVLKVAPDLLGKYLVRRFHNGKIAKYKITEVEAYSGEEDLACHASKGRTPRTETMYLPGGVLYVYLIYGMYWMMNIVTGPPDHPEAVLIRGIADYNGPGKLTRHLNLDKSFNGEDLTISSRIWIEDTGIRPAYTTSPRVGVDYAGDYWKSKPWRFVVNDEVNKIKAEGPRDKNQDTSKETSNI